MQNAEVLIQDHWKKNELLHMDGIMFDTGKVLLFEDRDLFDETEKELTIVPIEETTVEEFQEGYLDGWIETVPYVAYAVDPSSGDHILCGEGMMGNEGFVARVDPTHTILKWGMFSTFSNPFSKVEVVEDKIWAYSTHEHKWIIPIDYPETVKIEL